MELRTTFSILAILMTFSVFSISQSAKPDTGIEGLIRVSPAHGGATRVGEPSSKPLANTTFVAKSDSGASGEFTTDDQGHFKVVLEPGHYTITRKGDAGGIGHYGPFDVLVAAGQMTRVEWQCDSGMR